MKGVLCIVGENNLKFTTYETKSKNIHKMKPQSKVESLPDKVDVTIPKRL